MEGKGRRRREKERRRERITEARKTSTGREKRNDLQRGEGEERVVAAEKEKQFEEERDEKRRYGEIGRRRETVKESRDIIEREGRKGYKGEKDRGKETKRKRPGLTTRACFTRCCVRTRRVEPWKQKEAKVAMKEVEEEVVVVCDEGEGGGGKGEEARRGRVDRGQRAREGQGRRVSSSCNAINPVAVHHVDTILVDSFQAARVVGVGFCAITSLAGPTCTRNTGRASHVHAGCTRALLWRDREKRCKRERGNTSSVECVLCPGSIFPRGPTDYVK